MSESYTLLSSMVATSTPTFLEEAFYTVLLIGLLVWLLRFMQRNKMFEPEPKRRRFRRR